jgi:transposase-like protein
LGPRAATSGLNATPRCPFCDSEVVERVGRWGGQIITSQWRCDGCGSYFEAVREELADDPVDPSDPTDSASSEK